MPTLRSIAVTFVASAWIFVVVSPRHRRAMARRLAEATRFVSQRIVDREARDRSQALDRWEGEGGSAQSGVRARDMYSKRAPAW